MTREWGGFIQLVAHQVACARRSHGLLSLQLHSREPLGPSPAAGLLGWWGHPKSPEERMAAGDSMVHARAWKGGGSGAVAAAAAARAVAAASGGGTCVAVSMVSGA